MVPCAVFVWKCYRLIKNWSARPWLKKTKIFEIWILLRYFRMSRYECDVCFKNINITSVFSCIPMWAWCLSQKCEYVIGVFGHPDMSVKYISKMRTCHRCFRTPRYEREVYFKNTNIFSVFSHIPIWVWHLFQKYEYVLGIFVHPGMSVTYVPKICIFPRYFRTSRYGRDICSKNIDSSSVFSYIPIWAWHIFQKYQHCLRIFVHAGVNVTSVSKILIEGRYLLF